MFCQEESTRQAGRQAGEDRQAGTGGGGRPSREPAMGRKQAGRQAVPGSASDVLCIGLTRGCMCTVGRQAG